MLPISEFSRLNSCSRLEKGYLFEMYMQMLLEQKNVEYVGNPSNFGKWVKRTNTGHDIKVRTPSGWIKVECKYITKRIYLHGLVEIGTVEQQTYLLLMISF